MANEIPEEQWSFQPNWESAFPYALSSHLKCLEADPDSETNKEEVKKNIGIVKASIDALAVKDQNCDDHKRWILVLWYNMIREDASVYSLFEQAAKEKPKEGKFWAFGPLVSCLEQAQSSYVADKAAWLLTAIMANASSHFSSEDVKSVLSKIVANTSILTQNWSDDSAQASSDSSSCTHMGSLEAITNLLKGADFRTTVWEYPGTRELIFSTDPRSAPPGELYKCVFSIWMLSFDAKITKSLKEHKVIQKFKEILNVTRAEKVVRLSLTVLRNFLDHKDLCEDIVENGLLEAVQQLEYEKWRDADLYEEIKSMSDQISTEVNLLSNFDRYTRELESKKLKWGFIHSKKFWAENVMKFEKDNYKAMKMLRDLLLDRVTDSETIAVACHDVGEFVALHPMGKKTVGPAVKDRVMQLMTDQDADREVRREALLCCQKIMLNKWQELEVKK